MLASLVHPHGLRFSCFFKTYFTIKVYRPTGTSEVLVVLPQLYRKGRYVYSSRPVTQFETRAIGDSEPLTDTPGLVNEDPLGGGWFFKMKIEDLSALDDLLDEDAYKDLIE